MRASTQRFASPGAANSSGTRQVSPSRQSKVSPEYRRMLARIKYSGVDANIEQVRRGMA